MLYPVDKNVDNLQNPVDRLCITFDLSTGWSYPQSYPQTYPQLLPLLSTGLSTGRLASYLSWINTFRYGVDVIHKPPGLSTAFVDKPRKPWTKGASLSTGNGCPVDGVWITFASKASALLQSTPPQGEGFRGLFGVRRGLSPLAFDVVGNLVYLVEGVAVTVDEVGDLGGSVHYGRVVPAAESAPDLG
jgi:hypothetical protein